MRLFDFLNSTAGIFPATSLMVVTATNIRPITNLLVEQNTLVLSTNNQHNGLTLEQFYQQVTAISQNLTLVYQLDNHLIRQPLWGYRIDQAHRQLLLK